jgi:excisionase family DNA binding protein
MIDGVDMDGVRQINAVMERPAGAPVGVPPAASSASLLTKPMTIREAAGFYNVSDRTVRNWIKRDGLRVFKNHGTVRIDPHDLAEFFEQHKQGLERGSDGIRGE